jgi:thioesterase domain-containing protein/aryl carrier-like protein
MCSSSITAIHLACQSLISGESRLAVAGGVNLSIHPKKYIGLSLGMMMGSSPKSRSFSDGDGYIPAEGVGCVLLKALTAAQADGDHILGIIKASAVNHSGPSAGFGVPNPNSQVRLLEENFLRAGVAVDTISYIESAANGSALGDSIEFNALSKVFGRSVEEGTRVALGSVKSNIGHAEAVSGMSQLAKVLLQMQHKQLVPTLQMGALNPNLNVDASPFVLQSTLAPWERPVRLINGQSTEIPRRASISAFGAGGANGHLVVEEYINDKRPDSINNAHQLIVLSAQSLQSLRQRVSQLLGFSQHNPDVPLVDIAYTLQVGREAMAWRLALVIEPHSTLVEALESCLSAESFKTQNNVYFSGGAERNQDTNLLLSGGGAEAMLQAILAEKDWHKLALFWVSKGKVNWQKLYGAALPRRIMLPSYAFEKLHCWITPQQPATPSVAEPKAEVFNPVAQPLIVDILAEAVGVSAEQLDQSLNLLEYGLNSVSMVRLLSRLQQVVPVFQAEHLLKNPSIEQLVRLAEKLVTNESGHAPPYFPELVRLGQSSKGRPVFWFHAAIGGVEAYWPLAQKISRPFYGIQARGWATDAAPLQGIAAMASYYADIISRIQPEGPYDLGGYSLGGTLAYEVTRCLQLKGERVDSIIMLDSFDSHTLQQSQTSRESQLFCAVNTMLSAELVVEEPSLDGLIHRDQIDSSLSYDALCEQLISTPQGRGLSASYDQLSHELNRRVQVQHGYNVAGYQIQALPRPKEVECFYFKNQSGIFLGELAAYFSLEEDLSIDNKCYWQEWQTYLPNFNITDVPSANHMLVLSEPALQTIETFCCQYYQSYTADTQTDPQMAGQTGLN